jgi:hypothetical protein
MYGKKGKKGKLEKFNMMKSGDGWGEDDEVEKEDEYYMKGGARKRKEMKETKEMTMAESTRPDKRSMRDVRRNPWKRAKF